MPQSFAERLAAEKAALARSSHKPDLDPLKGRSVDDVLNESRGVGGAKKRIRLDDDWDRIEADARALGEQRKAERGAEKAPVAWEAAKGAMLPAAFLGGPIGVAAGGALALEGIRNAVDDPSPVNVGMAALGATPAVSMLRRGGRAVGKGVDEARQFVYGPTRRGFENAKQPPKVDWEALSDIRRADKAVTKPISAPSAPSPRERLTTELDETFSVGNKADEEWLSANPAKPRQSSGMQAIEMLDDAPVEQSLGSMDEVDAAIGGMSRRTSKRVGSSRLNTKLDEQRAALGKARRHGMGGFSGLPELSEAELQRISANISRVTGK